MGQGVKTDGPQLGRSWRVFTSVLPYLLPPALSVALGRGEDWDFFFFNVILAFALAFHQVAGTMLGAFPFMSCSVPTTTCEVAVSSMSWMRNLRQEVMSFPSSPNLSSRHHSWCSSSEMNTGVSSVGTPGPFSSHQIYLFVSSFMRNRP